MPDATVTPTPTPSPTPSPTPTPTPAPEWHGFTDAADVAYVGNKGWKAPADVVKSYRDAEKLIGRSPDQLLVLPRADDPVGQRALHTRLGMPETPDKYEFDVPKGATIDAGFDKWARSTFHELGLTAAQAKNLTASHNKFLGEVSSKAETDYKTTVATDKQALLAEWRGGYDHQMGVAKGAAKALGFTGEMIDAMESTVGYGATMKFFAELGKKMGEDTLVIPGGGGDKRFDNTLTPAEAKVQWEEKKLDANFMAALRDKSHPGHAGAQAKQTSLFKVMFPEG